MRDPAVPILYRLPAESYKVVDTRPVTLYNKRAAVTGLYYRKFLHRIKGDFLAGLLHRSVRNTRMRPRFKIKNTHVYYILAVFV